MSSTTNAKRLILLAAFAAVLPAMSARGEESNRNEVRANLERDGWSVIWGKNFTEADWLRGTKAIAESIATENPGPFLVWFGQTLDENFAKLERNLEGVSRRDLDRWVLQSLKQKQIVTYRGFHIEAGFATYDRWERIVYDEPRTRSIPRPPFFEAFTERVERRSNLPNWHQFYIRYRLVGARPDSPRGGPEPRVDTASVQFRYTIRNDSGRTVRFRLPSGREYTLESGERGSYTFTGDPSSASVYVYGTDRSYRLKAGDHRFWWMRDERRIGLDIEGR